MSVQACDLAVEFAYRFGRAPERSFEVLPEAKTRRLCRPLGQASLEAIHPGDIAEWLSGMAELARFMGQAEGCAAPA